MLAFKIAQKTMRSNAIHSQRHFSKFLKSFATVDPENLSASSKTQNLVKGTWVDADDYLELPDPLKGGVMYKVACSTLQDPSIKNVV